MPVKAVLLDVIGTTVLEKQPAVIEQCFQSAFYTCGISLDSTSLQRCRGQDKQAAIAALLGRQSSPERIAKILGLFKTYFKERLHNLIKHPSFARLVDELHHKGIRVGIGTGLPTELFQVLFQGIRFGNSLFEAVIMVDSFFVAKLFPLIITAIKKPEPNIPVN